jgi:hypothetical protein
VASEEKLLSEAIAHLRSPAAIRERCGKVLEQGLDGGLAHFAIRLDRLPSVVERVVEVTRRTYPGLDIPYHSRWSHFCAGGIDRVAEWNEKVAVGDTDERARCDVDLTVVSVLLDAGAGSRWSYRERASGEIFSRSEGLAVASLRLFLDGGFSGDGHRLRADARGLELLSEDRLAAGFQATADNPLAGLAGRVALMRDLGKTLRNAPEFFGSDARVGNLFDLLKSRARDGVLPATAILTAVLEGLGPIWPAGASIGGVRLGDVWKHSAAGGTGVGSGLVPFHKLSQWLTYSLIAPLEAAGLEVVELDELTALAEYRNGGLLVDLGVLEPKHEEVTEVVHPPDSEIVVEWRALTVALVDSVAEGVRAALHLDRTALPLVKVLEGGTWRAGREVANEHREGGVPPIGVESHGTVF